MAAWARTLRVAMLVANDMRYDSRVRRTAAALAAEGHTVTVYAERARAVAQPEREQVDGYEIVRVAIPGRPQRPDPGGLRAARAGRRFPIPSRRRLVMAAYRVTKPLVGETLPFLVGWRIRWHAWGDRVQRVAEPADIWHANDMSTLGTALACARRLGGRVIYDSHEIFTEAGAAAELPKWVRRGLRRVERGWAQRCDAVITVNESLARYLRDELDVPSVTVVHNCSTAPDQHRSLLRSSLGLAADDKLVLYHGGLTHGRGLASLICAMEVAALGDAHLAIMGYGSLRTELQELAAGSTARDRIHFLPPAAPEVLTEWVADAAVAAMPIEPNSLNHRLSSPNKLFEALAAGVPVVGPDFVEFRRILIEQPPAPLGRLHSGHEPADIAAAIVGILELDVADRAELRARCRAASEARWNWQSERESLLDVYAALAAKPPVAAAARQPAVATAADAMSYPPERAP